ncbi:MAG TPA: thioesterase family protein [Gemmatimonadales bacterium]|nr:thioesterase family protein [Gemmatimonadales bacterium]
MIRHWRNAAALWSRARDTRRVSSPDAAAALGAEFPVVIEIPVQWGEMDAYGHVNNAVYFRYFESARIAYFQRCGLLESYKSRAVGAILHSTQCRFRVALQYPDTALIGTRVIDVQDDRFTMAYRVVSRAHNVVAAEGQGIIVAFDYTTRTKTRLPEDVRQGIRKMEDRR